MSDILQISDAKRALLDKLVRGDLPKSVLQTEHRTVSSPANEAKPPERMVAIQTHGTMPPLFFLHGQWNGDGFYSYPLARGLGPEQPFYAMDPYTFEGQRLPPTLGAIAAMHLQSIRRVQPKGPYLLGGFCNGALVAYEIAQQLYSQGERVDLLAMIDPMPPTQLALALSSAIRHPMGLIHTSRDLVFVGAVLAGCVTSTRRLLHPGEDRQLDQSLRLIHGYRLLRKGFNMVRHTHHAHGEGHDELVTATVSTGRRPHGAAWFPTPDDLRSDYEAVFVWIASRYLLARYPGKISLLWSRVPDPGFAYWRAAWEHLLADKDQGDVETCIVPGTHRSVRSEDVHHLAACLRGCIERALA